MYNALAGYVLNLVFKNLLSLLILRMKTVPTKIMEIGVAEGDGAELIITTCKKRGARNIRYYGFDLFETTKKKDVMERLKKTGANIRLFKGDTKKYDITVKRICWVKAK